MDPDDDDEVAEEAPPAPPSTAPSPPSSPGSSPTIPPELTLSLEYPGGDANANANANRRASSHAKRHSRDSYGSAQPVEYYMDENTEVVSDTNRALLGDADEQTIIMGGAGVNGTGGSAYASSTTSVGAGSGVTVGGILRGEWTAAAVAALMPPPPPSLVLPSPAAAASAVAKEPTRQQQQHQPPERKWMPMVTVDPQMAAAEEEAASRNGGSGRGDRHNHGPVDEEQGELLMSANSIARVSAKRHGVFAVNKNAKQMSLNEASEMSGSNNAQEQLRNLKILVISGGISIFCGIIFVIIGTLS
ncbi:hypothetical protein Pelo_3188 [Pelomyxa schiedti]|nr:hypothetical protein Pelo_3188 [Pelomyxa schiedti]